MVRRLRDPAARARIARQLAGDDLSNVMVLGVLDSTLKRYEGRRISDIARAEGRNPRDVLCDILALLHEGKVAVTGKPAELKAALGATATLDDVSVHYSGGSIQEGGNYRDIRQTRRTAGRLG